MVCYSIGLLRRVLLFYVIGAWNVWTTTGPSVRGTVIPRVDWMAGGQTTLNAILNSKTNTNVAKNVILFLGDGMGISTVTASRIYMGQKNGQFGEEGWLEFDKFPHTGLAKTYNVDAQVPDSAGTATAFLCGVKTIEAGIGINEAVLQNGRCDLMAGNSVDSILRWSIKEGKRTGVVTTARVTHATPSAAYAHSCDRNWETDSKVPVGYRYQPLCEDIASQLVSKNSDINVIMGGGRRHFLPDTVTDPEYATTRGTRLDKRNLIEQWKTDMANRSASHIYVWNQQMFDVVNPDTTDHILGLFQPSHMQFELDRSSDAAGEPSLAEMTDKAIRILRRSNKGYFLLVEGGRIDHGHHAGVAKNALEDTVAFNEAVRQALSLTSTSDTLIVVTADHSHTFVLGGYPSRGNPILGLVDEEGVLREPTTDGLPYLTLMYTTGPGILGRTNLTGVNTAANTFKQPTNVPMVDETHGGEDVAVYAIGPMSHLFTGVYEQNYIAHAMAYASCVGANKNHCSTRTSSAAWRMTEKSQLLVVLVLAVNALPVI